MSTKFQLFSYQNRFKFQYDNTLRNFRILKIK
nr:MAG TPA: hypothetical protein [Caudoviricetes sp.]